MAAQVNDKSFKDVARQMRTFAQYVDGMHQPRIARMYEEAAGRLEDGVTPDQLHEICEAVLNSFGAHQDGLLVIYVQKPDGSPDEDETEKYYALLKALRVFARRNLWETKLSWIFNGFRW